MANQYTQNLSKYNFRGKYYSVRKLHALPECKVTLNTLKGRFSRNKIKAQGFTVEELVVLSVEELKALAIKKRQAEGYIFKRQSSYDFRPELFNHG